MPWAVADAVARTCARIVLLLFRLYENKCTVKLHKSDANGTFACCALSSSLSLPHSIYLPDTCVCECVCVSKYLSLITPKYTDKSLSKYRPLSIYMPMPVRQCVCLWVCAMCVRASVCAMCVCVRVPLLAQVRWFCSASVGVNAPQMLSSVDLPPPAPSLVLSLSCMHKYLHCLQQLLMIEPSIICFCFCLFGNKESR